MTGAPRDPLPAPIHEPERNQVGALLRELNGLRVAVLHPHDAEVRILISHLRRIGSHVTEFWPIPARIDDDFDVIIMAIELDQRSQMETFVASRGELSPPLVAVVGYENPAMLQLVLESCAVAILERPLKPFGLLTNLMMARTLWRQKACALAQIRKLESRFATVSKLTMAKTILIAREGLTEQEAHSRIQKLAMTQRTTVAEVAQSIILASDAKG